MRVPDDKKRRQIIDTAAEMFATQPYHKVRLDDVAATAGVGKGTLYVYFHSKEDLYFSLIFEGFGLLIDRLRTPPPGEQPSPIQRLHKIINELVDFAFQHPQLFELMRTVGPPKEQKEWVNRRQEMFELIEQTISDGVALGELRDPNPELTALFIPGLVRSAMLFASKNLDAATLKQQIHSLLNHGLANSRPLSVAVV